jgi:glycosyltransferase involved in cell wall biosynthesis
VILKSASGVVVTPGSVPEMVDAIVAVADSPASERDDMGNRGRQYYQEAFSESVVSAKLELLLEAAAAQSGRGT